jgi:hypothetical protein
MLSGEAVAEWFKYETEPMELADMRQNGVRSLAVMCHGCRHEVILNVDKYPVICWCASSARGWSIAQPLLNHAKSGSFQRVVFRNVDTRTPDGATTAVSQTRNVARLPRGRCATESDRPSR